MGHSKAECYKCQSRKHWLTCRLSNRCLLKWLPNKLHSSEAWTSKPFVDIRPAVNHCFAPCPTAALFSQLCYISTFVGLQVPVEPVGHCDALRRRPVTFVNFQLQFRHWRSWAKRQKNPKSTICISQQRPGGRENVWEPGVQDVLLPLQILNTRPCKLWTGNSAYWHPLPFRSLNCMRKNFQKTLNRQRGETSERVAEKGSFFLGWVDVRWVSDSDTASTQQLL